MNAHTPRAGSSSGTPLDNKKESATASDTAKGAAGRGQEKALVKETTLDSVAGEEDPGASLDIVAPVVPQKGRAD